jgi:hypothetical protein
MVSLCMLYQRVASEGRPYLVKAAIVEASNELQQSSRNLFARALP